MSKASRRAGLVTGGGRGIGLAIVRAIARDGTPVAVVDRQAGEDPLPEGCIAIRRDVRDFDGAHTAVSEAEERLGPLSVAVLNAGISRDGASWRMSESDWREVIDVNLTGAFAYAQAVARGMRKRRGGAIVFVASINGLRGKFGLANYSASKAALVGLTRTLARELGPTGIRVNAVAPGFVRTSLTSGLEDRFVEAAREETALGRLGEPEDIAEVVAFLLSDRARHVTGETIRIDGGQTA